MHHLGIDWYSSDPSTRAYTWNSLGTPNDHPTWMQCMCMLRHACTFHAPRTADRLSSRMSHCSVDPTSPSGTRHITVLPSTPGVG